MLILKIIRNAPLSIIRKLYDTGSQLPQRNHTNVQDHVLSALGLRKASMAVKEKSCSEEKEEEEEGRRNWDCN